MSLADLTVFYPWTFLIHLARGFLVFNIMNSMLKPKRNIILSLFSFVGILMVYSGITITFANFQISVIEYIIAMGYYALIFVLSLFWFEGKASRKLFAIFMAVLTNTVSIMVYALIRGLFFGFDLTPIASNIIPHSEVVMQALCMFSFSFVVAAFFKLIFQKKKNYVAQNRTLYLLYLFPSTHIINVYILLMAFKIYDLNNMLLDSIAADIGTFGFISYIGCVVADIFIIFAINYIEKIEDKNFKYEKAVAQNEIDYARIKHMQEEKVAISKIRHDMSGIISTAIGFIELGKNDKALSILSNANSDVFDANEKYSMSDLINIIIQMKTKSALSEGVQLSFVVHETEAVKIDDYDLSRVLNNLIDNSVNAAKQTDIKHSEVKIDINDDIIISTKNKFNPKAKKSSNDNNLHGFGIKIIKEIVSKHDGNFVVKKENDDYTTITTMKNTKD